MIISKCICDRCGAETKEKINKKYIVAKYEISALVPTKHYDFCDNCEAELIKWLEINKKDV